MRILISLATLAVLATSASAATTRVIHSFCSSAQCADGGEPSGVAIDATGTIYGTSYRNNPQDNGTIYALSPDGAGNFTYKLLYSFCKEAQCADGARPQGRLIVDVDGNLYGTTFAGGPHGGGEVFELVPNADRTHWKLKVLYGFCKESGCTFDGGVIFKFEKSGGAWNETVLYDFTGGNDGAVPQGVTISRTGAIYGATGFGGDANNGGILFKLVPGTPWQETTLHHFCGAADCADGKRPNNAVVIDGTRAIFGSTENGGGHDGDIFAEGGGTAFRFAGGTFTSLTQFCAQASCADGEYPRGQMVVGPGGKVYGTTLAGGPDGWGETYEITP